ncbi:envelope stress response membrane protein PspC [Allosphingosinicella flava]|uniref:Envelope stress response membrane protein PspC n=1 Tax=Allosphingosinicella flava TaxID=2771430 RepID=A0A7T2GL36_9SPHN|nr:envelope stress response membrane protein PspC [Sphingosinicella flava]QPQ55812.1 envelope stress response membrane protein PspC [Sphingosinicella flava]
MSARHTKFYRDKQNAKWLGVCAGIADYTGIDVTLIRIGLVAATMLGSGAPFIVYLIAGYIAPSKPRELDYTTPDDKKFWQGVRASPTRTVKTVRSKFRDIDRRLANIETYVTSSDNRLADEIEKLR